MCRGGVWLRAASVLACASLGAAQLRPRRVGVDPLGETVESSGGVGAGGADQFNAAGMQAGLEQMMRAAGAGGGGEGGDLNAMMLNSLKDNPFLANLAESNPEIADLVNNPQARTLRRVTSPPRPGSHARRAAQALQGKMAEAMAALGADGTNLNEKLMEEFQSVLTDPEKMRQGLEQARRCDGRCSRDASA